MIDCQIVLLPVSFGLSEAKLLKGDQYLPKTFVPICLFHKIECQMVVLYHKLGIEVDHYQGKSLILSKLLDQ